MRSGVVSRQSIRSGIVRHQNQKSVPVVAALSRHPSDLTSFVTRCYCSGRALFQADPDIHPIGHRSPLPTLPRMPSIPTSIRSGIVRHWSIERTTVRRRQIPISIRVGGRSRHPSDRASFVTCERDSPEGNPDIPSDRTSFLTGDVSVWLRRMIQSRHPSDRASFVTGRSSVFRSPG